MQNTRKTKLTPRKQARVILRAKFGDTSFGKTAHQKAVAQLADYARKFVLRTWHGKIGEDQVIRLTFSDADFEIRFRPPSKDGFTKFPFVKRGKLDRRAMDRDIGEQYLYKDDNDYRARVTEKETRAEAIERMKKWRSVLVDEEFTTDIVDYEYTDKTKTKVRKKFVPVTYKRKVKMNLLLPN